LLGCGGSSPEKYLAEGESHFDKKEYDKAIQCYEKAIKVQPSAAAYNLLGMAYRGKSQQVRQELQAQEITAFQKALDLDPKYWLSLFNLGATYYFMGEKAKAAPLFKKALALNPDHPEKEVVKKMIAEGEAEP
jgi:tetratricopeptide (TPR) repeat protein